MATEPTDKFLGKLRISKETINRDLRESPTYLYVYGLKELKLQEAYDILELRLDTAMAKIATQTRAKYKGVKSALSETHIKDLVNSNQEIIDLKEKLIETKNYLRLAKLKSKALEDKRDKVVNYAHNVREELRSSTGTRQSLKHKETA